MRFPSTALLASTLLAISAKARFIIYADEWHPARPTNPRDRAGIDHVILAFAPANATATFQPKVPVHTIRTEFPNAKVMIAVGGWGDTAGFCQATKSDASMLAFAADIATMLARTGADGVGEYTIYLNWLLVDADNRRHRLGISWRQRGGLQTSDERGSGLPDRRVSQITSCRPCRYWEEAAFDRCPRKGRPVIIHMFEVSQLTCSSRYAWIHSNNRTPDLVIRRFHQRK